jgi:hypothetical protein
MSGIALRSNDVSATVDQFCDKLRDRLNAFEGQFQSFAADMQSQSDKAETTVRGKLEESSAKVEAQKEHIEKDPSQPQGDGPAEGRRDQGGGQRMEGEARDEEAAVRAERAELAILEGAVARLDADTLK